MANANKTPPAKKRFRVFIRAVEYPWVDLFASDTDEARELAECVGESDFQHSDFYDPEWEIDEVKELDVEDRFFPINAPTSGRSLDK